MPQRNRRVPIRVASALLALAGLATFASLLWAPARTFAQVLVRGDAPRVRTQVASLTVDDAVVAEGDAGTRELVFTVRLSEPSPDTVRVDAATADSTATLADGDYAAAGVRLTFLPGSVAESLSVAVNGDTRFEPDELLLVRLAAPENTVLADSEAVGAITNDDPPQLSVDDAVVTEGDAGTSALVFRLRLSGASAVPVSVTAETADSSATAADLDYEPASAQVTFAPGSVAESLVVLVNGDTRPEPDEALRLLLSAPTGATFADSEAVGVILDDDLPLVSVDDAEVSEGSAGTRDLWFRLHLSSAAGYPVSFDVATRDSTASAAAGDYVPVSLRFTFPPGVTTDSVAVPVNGDLAVEDDEFVMLGLSGASGAAFSDSVAAGRILDDELPVIAAADTAVDEGDSGTQLMWFRVRLTPPVNRAVRFHYKLFDGTATIADRDFQAASRDTLIAPGAGQVLVPVVVFGDSLLEANERFTFAITWAIGADVPQPAAIGTLRNDERTSFTRITTSVPAFAPGTLPPSWGDVDSDGRPDLPLYQNDGASFVEMPGMRGLLGDGNYHGSAWCDYDRDGDMDLVQMAYGGSERSYNFTHLFENTPSGLVEVAPAKGMDVVGFGETPTWADFDANGWPDLFLPFYSHTAPFRSYFFLNQGGGQFREFADSAGISLPNIPIQLRPEGVAVADWNGDGTLDLYCASHLFLNDGTAHFTDVRAQTGLPVMFDEGAQFVDYDDDGDLDLYLRTSRGPTLYRNDAGTYHDATAALGVGFVDWEWGDRWADLDADGDMDLLFFPPGAVGRLLLNRGDGTFREDSSFIGVFSGSSLASFADLDGDGDVDIAVGANGRQFARNQLERVPRGQAAYLKVRVEDDAGRLTAFGATVRLRSLDDPRHPVQTRIVDGGSGYLGQDEYTLTFGGVGQGSFDLEISYPAGPKALRVLAKSANPLLGGIRPGMTGPQLVVVRPGGQVTTEDINATAAVEPPIARPLSPLSPAAPNPARRSTRFAFSLPAPGEVSLTIHDLSGRTVRTLMQRVRVGGEASAAWDLRDDAGRDVPAGLYFARFQQDARHGSVQRVVVLR